MLSIYSKIIFLSGFLDYSGLFLCTVWNGYTSTITFELRNGEIFNGYYVANDKKIFGLLEIIGPKNLQRRENLLFTYRGDGRFAIDIFDQSKVEKYYVVAQPEIGKIIRITTF